MPSSQRILVFAAALFLSSGAMVRAQDKVGISLTPLSASLSAGQSAKFLATVTGVEFPFVTWIIMAPIMAGVVDTAPVTISPPPSGPSTLVY